ncbi:hypothetical protein NC651_008454 [Populus alba x Populus x berolinensis]|nr:hypothetical protein NC651_008454 [Populus alba x Populus x berolinensis]
MPSPCQMERWTPLMVARSWHRNELGVILTTQQENQSQICPSPYISIPSMSIVKIARQYIYKEFLFLLIGFCFPNIILLLPVMHIQTGNEFELGIID